MRLNRRTRMAVAVATVLSVLAVAGPAPGEGPARASSGDPSLAGPSPGWTPIPGSRLADDSSDIPLIGDPFLISGVVDRHWKHEAVAAHNPNANEYLVVWADGRNHETRELDIYGQLIAADGTRLGPDFRISGSFGTGDCSSPEVAFNEVNDEYLVVWQDTRALEVRGWDVYARRVSADGRRIGGDFRIGESAGSDQRIPSVAHNRFSNRYLIVWGDDRNLTTSGWDIYGQRLKPSGKPAGSEFRIATSSAPTDECPKAVIHNPISNRFLVVWTDAQYEWENVYGQVLKPTGVPAGDDFRINGAPIDTGMTRPAVALNEVRNQYLVAWTSGGDQAPEWRVEGRRIKASGKLAGDPIDINLSIPAQREQPAVSHDPSTDRYLAVWLALDQVVYGRHLRATGRPTGDAFPISDPAVTYREQWPRVTGNPIDGRHLVFWITPSLDGPPMDLYGRLVAG